MPRATRTLTTSPIEALARSAPRMSLRLPPARLVNTSLTCRSLSLRATSRPPRSPRNTQVVLRGNGLRTALQNRQTPNMQSITVADLGSDAFVLERSTAWIGPPPMATRTQSPRQRLPLQSSIGPRPSWRGRNTKRFARSWINHMLQRKPVDIHWSEGQIRLGSSWCSRVLNTHRSSIQKPSPQALKPIPNASR